MESYAGMAGEIVGHAVADQVGLETLVGEIARELVVGLIHAASLDEVAADDQIGSLHARAASVRPRAGLRKVW